MEIFDDFLESVRGGLGDLVSNTIGDFADSAKERAENFLTETQKDLKKWVKQLADGEISQDDFEFLVKGKKELGKIDALLEGGAAKAAVDKFRTGLIQLLIDSALGLIPK